MGRFYYILLASAIFIFGNGCKSRGPDVPKEMPGQVSVWSHSIDMGFAIDWDHLKAPALVDLYLTTDFSGRAAAIADEITQAGPDLAGLQEVALVQIEKDSGNGEEHPKVLLDFLAMLQERLAAQKRPYSVAGIIENLDIRFPVVLESEGPVMFHVIDRDVILARDGIAFSTVAARNFASARSASFTAGGRKETAQLRRGYVVVSASVKHATFQCVCTNLEAQSDPQVQGSQAQELIEALETLQLSSRLPLILMGEFNSPAPPAHPIGLAYQKVLSAGFCDNTPCGPSCFPPGVMGVALPDGRRNSYIFTRCAIDSQRIERLYAARGGRAPDDDIAAENGRSVLSAWIAARFRLPLSAARM